MACRHAAIDCAAGDDTSGRACCRAEQTMTEQAMADQRTGDAADDLAGGRRGTAAIMVIIVAAAVIMMTMPDAGVGWNRDGRTGRHGKRRSGRDPGKCFHVLRPYVSPV